MFVREKRINGYTYLYLVETVRENGRACSWSIPSGWPRP
jgi:hypothetical protein